MITKTLILTFSSLVVCACAVLPPKLNLPPTATTIEELEPYLQKAVVSNEPPSISIAVLKDNETVYAKAFGAIDSTGTVPATPDTVYHWWSITKLFTAVAILQLQERNQLSINDTVESHLPKFSSRGKFSENENITIKQLLSHSSGLGDIGMAILGWVHFDGDEHPNQSDLFANKVDKYNKLKAPIGQEGRYSNFGYFALAALIESVSGKTYEEYIIDNIIKPLNMRHTDFIYRGAMANNKAIGSHPNDAISKIVPLYLDTDRAIDKKVNGTLWFNNVYSDQKGSTGLIGSANDLIKFMQLFLPEHQNSAYPVLSKSSIALMQTPVVDIVKSPAPAKKLQFGLGWFIDDRNPQRVLIHGGAGMAYVSMVMLYPQENMATVVMSNSTYLGRSMGYKLSQLLAKIEW